MPQQDLIGLVLSTAGVENALVEGALILVLQIQIVFLSVYLSAGVARRTLWAGSRPRRRRKTGQEQQKLSYSNCSLVCLLVGGGAGESNRRMS